ncbi:MAG: photosystem I assembly protein Ycf4 [Cyanobacteria bacterium J06642_2]
MVAEASQEQTYLRYEVTGSRRPSTVFWALALTGGGLGFGLAGLSSWTGTNLLPFGQPTALMFIPQGIAMLFYGVAGTLVGAYQWLSLLWNLGGGYNEFDRGTGKATITRQGFPGKNRSIQLQYDLADIQGIRVDINEGINPKRAIYLKVKGRGDIPLTRVGRPLPLAEIEDRGAELARFFGLPLEGL